MQEVTDPDGRLRILLDLYESFFQRVEPKLAAQAGIAFTPVEIVDFILRSADAVSRQEFGRGLTAEGVHILDPFVGTGTFPYRLLTLPDLVTDQDLGPQIRIGVARQRMDPAFLLHRRPQGSNRAI